MNFPKNGNLKKKTIKNTIRKCVQERKIDPNPTHHNKFDKYTANRKKSQDWFEIGNYIALPIRYNCLVAWQHVAACPTLDSQ